jgi:hypothetical protein
MCRICCLSPLSGDTAYDFSGYGRHCYGCLVSGSAMKWSSEVSDVIDSGHARTDGVNYVTMTPAVPFLTKMDFTICLWCVAQSATDRQPFDDFFF